MVATAYGNGYGLPNASGIVKESPISDIKPINSKAVMESNSDLILWESYKYECIPGYTASLMIKELKKMIMKGKRDVDKKSNDRIPSINTPQQCVNGPIFKDWRYIN